MMEYKYVSLKDPYMWLAYEIAKSFYLIKKWNKKTSPVAIIVQDEKYISHGICADGKHAVLGTCERLEVRGSSYEKCPHCQEEEHAERKALAFAYDKNLNGAVVYVYGHYKLCESCIKALNDRGIKKCYLLENSEVLFDRHNVNTVLNTAKQFEI